MIISTRIASLFLLVLAPTHSLSLSVIYLSAIMLVKRRNS